MVFLVRGRGAENIEKKKKIGRRNEEYKESQITTMNIFGFTFYIKK